MKNCIDNDEQIILQMQLNKQKQQMYLDYKDVSDTLLSLLSTAEAIALQNSENKELGYYDEYDTAKYKNTNSQIIQLLRLLREFNGMRNDFINQYKEYKLPENLTLNYINKKILYWQSFISKNTNLYNYYNEILNVINGKTNVNVNKELNKYYDKNVKLTEEQQQRRWDNMIEAKHLCLESDKEVIDEYMNTGKYIYKVKYDKKAGRYVGFLIDKHNHDNFIEVDYK